MFTSQLEVQTAMYGLLVPNGTIDSQLASYGLIGIYDWQAVPQNAPFDYLTMGDGYEVPYDTMGDPGTADGWLYYSMLHIWSRQRGSAPAMQMVGRLHELFHRQELPLATLKHVYTESYRTMKLYDTSTIDPVLHVTVQYITYSVQQ